MVPNSSLAYAAKVTKYLSNTNVVRTSMNISEIFGWSIFSWFEAERSFFIAF